MSAPTRPSPGDAPAADADAHSAPQPDSINAAAVASVLAATVAACWAGYFLFTGMPQFTLGVYPATLTMHVLAGAAAVLLLMALAVTRRLPGGTPLDWAVLALAVAFSLATAASISTRVSIEWMMTASVGVIAFYALADLPLLTAERLRWAVLALVSALSVYALWVVGNDYADYLRLVREVEGIDSGNIFPPTVPRVHSVSDHTNVFAMLLVLFGPFLVAGAVRPGYWWERPLALDALFVVGWALFLTLSRGAWMGAVTGAAVALLLSWLTIRITQREAAGQPVTWEAYIPQNLTPTAIAAILGALALAAFGALGFLSASETRPSWLFRGSLSPREDAWDSALEMFGEYPLLGAGPHTFGLLYPEVSGRFLVHTQHAHNAFLQVAVDAGIVGLLALTFALAVTGWMLWRTWRVGSLERRLLAVACAAGLIGFGVHNMVDAANSWKAPLVALALVLAIVARNYAESGADMPALRRLRPDVRRYGGWAARGAIVLLLLAPFVAWARFDPPHRDYWRGVTALNERDGPDSLANAIGHLQDAVNADSSMMVYQMQLGIAQSIAYIEGGERDRSLIENAIIHLERAVDLDERSDLARANLARAYQLAGRDGEAAQQATVARLTIFHVPPVLVAGEVFEALGREADAVSTYGQSISMDAGLANSTFWDGTEFRRDHFDEILAASVIGDNACTYGAFLVEAKRFGVRDSLAGLEDSREDCEAIAFTRPDDLHARVNLAKIQLELGDPAAARVHLEYAIDRQPDFGPARTELGRWLQSQGDDEGAKAQWVRGTELGEAESVWLLGETYPDGQVPQDLRDRLNALLTGRGSSVRNDTVSIVYYRQRYARLSPVFPLIPGDWTRAVPRPYATMTDALARWEREARR
ncbi:MAG TPA: O-antigen ligase family protein [Dehalococcoidia bacterium]|nr:O-antigen ligase family protein [Dehalococcoidia bacterium]